MLSSGLEKAGVLSSGQTYFEDWCMRVIRRVRSLTLILFWAHNICWWSWWPWWPWWSFFSATSQPLIRSVLRCCPSLRGRYPSASAGCKTSEEADPWFSTVVAFADVIDEERGRIHRGLCRVFWDVRNLLPTFEAGQVWTEVQQCLYGCIDSRVYNPQYWLLSPWIRVICSSKYQRFILDELLYSTWVEVKTSRRLEPWVFVIWQFNGEQRRCTDPSILWFIKIEISIFDIFNILLTFEAD